MILSTTFDVPGRTIAQNLGIARGNVVRGRSIGRNIVASFRMLVGGEIHEYTKLMAESREQALDRLIEHAQSLGADAVIGLRFDATEAGAQTPATEVLAYGTAVKLA
ncbi:MAG: YbjQ family protein [Vitreimonas sp.]